MNRHFLGVVVAGITLLFLVMIKPFLMTLVIAAILASLCQPLYKRLCKLFREHRTPASLLTLLIVILLILVPLVSLLGVVTAQAIKVGNAITPWVQAQINDPDQLMLKLQGLPFYQTIEPYHDEILTRAGEAVGFVSRFMVNNLSAATAGTIHFLFMLVIMVYAMYFFLVHGGRWLEAAMSRLPLDNTIERRLLDRFRSVSRATLKGTLVIGLLQGGLAGLAFWAVGIPSALFWSAIMVVLSIIPGIGTAIVWLPAAIVLLAGGGDGQRRGADPFLRPDRRRCG